MYLGDEIQSSNFDQIREEGICKTVCLANECTDDGEHLHWMLPHVHDELGLYWNIDKFKAV